jgi:hypothetical protein
VLFTILKIGQNDFVSKYLPNDPRIGYKYLSNLVELIEINVNVEEEFKKFEKVFEKDEFMEF